MARLTGSEGDLMGVLCLAGRERAFSSGEQHLLEALAGHASVALENARLFSWIERSKKQWIEDFDAITDFIVVHDATDRILRVNRSLAGHLRLKPAGIDWAAHGNAAIAGARESSDALARSAGICRRGRKNMCRRRMSGLI